MTPVFVGSYQNELSIIEAEFEKVDKRDHQKCTELAYRFAATDLIIDKMFFTLIDRTNPQADKLIATLNVVVPPKDVLMVEKTMIVKMYQKAKELFKKFEEMQNNFEQSKVQSLPEQYIPLAREMSKLSAATSKKTV